MRYALKYPVIRDYRQERGRDIYGTGQDDSP